MLSIPLPFVVSLMLLVLAASLVARRSEGTRLAALFLLMCALTTTVVGLRWLLDWAWLRALQPILAGLIPVLAWWVFARARQAISLPWWHWLAPVVIGFSSVTYPWWQPPLDIMLTALYVVYGVALWVSARDPQELENIPFSELPYARYATQVGAGMLLFSALIDGVLSLDFIFWQGQHATLIITIGHAILLPLLALAVVWTSLHTQTTPQSVSTAETKIETEPAGAEDDNESRQDREDAEGIIQRLTTLLETQKLYLEPDLTLARLARKLGLPSRQISAAVNLCLEQNISQWINGYRIAHAQHLLKNTDLAITEIYLEAGFQTKSNFHREFSRLVGVTPSAYRKDSSIDLKSPISQSHVR
ncbi:helix-turn-helix transcriptional regulator [Maribrevibacterium harenarium]|uniref:Helix-turn-helix transcriptional regulator n=1 Tax=Maribrevibacterium harenarium TaxID=2589817 RepID=A0A501WZT8_9GAMM|nr:AraC family transcriptional regulator [Maribrevibacterium harenarium]TPE53327.1 helix-turn-helix transcriptional regulator [Maribrevibacterium harenarium]